MRSGRCIFDPGEPISPGVLFTFDDGTDTQYTTAYPYMASKGIVGTIFVVTGDIGSGGNKLNWEQCATMYGAGWDIANHTQVHPDLTTLTQAQVEAEVEAARDDLLAQGFTRSARHVAYPFGASNATVRAGMAASLMKSGRIVGPDMVGTDPYTDGRYSLESYNIQYTTTLQAVKDGIDAGIAAGKWPVLTFHNLVETPTGQTEWAISDFQSLVDYVIAQGYLTYTISEFNRMLDIYHGVLE